MFARAPPRLTASPRLAGDSRYPKPKNYSQAKGQLEPHPGFACLFLLLRVWDLCACCLPFLVTGRGVGRWWSGLRACYIQRLTTQPSGFNVGNSNLTNYGLGCRIQGLGFIGFRGSYPFRGFCPKALSELAG